MNRYQINYFSEPSWPQNLTEELPNPEQLTYCLLESKANEHQKTYHDKSDDADKSQVMEVESARSQRDFMQQMFNYREEPDLLQIINSMEALANESTEPSKQKIVFDQESNQQVQSSFIISSEEQDESDYQFTGANSKKTKPIAKYRRFSKQEKQRIVQEARTSNFRKTAEKYDISTSSLTRWTKSCQRKKGAGRRVRDNNMEDRVKAWIKQEIKANRGEKLSKRAIQNKAKVYAKNPLFKASKGWLERFVARNFELGLDVILGIKSRPREEDDYILGNISTGVTETATIPRTSDRLREKKGLYPSNLEILIKAIYTEEQ